MNKRSFNGISRGHESGVALLVVLLLLVIVTIIGIASMRGAIMQQRMAANVASRGMAFQVAEAGLRQAELLVRDGTITFPSSGCSAGRCKDAAWSTTANFWTSGSGYEDGTPVSVGIGDVRPRFVIEDYGRTTLSSSGGCIDMTKPCMASVSQNVYRITSYAAVANGAEVILQTIYRR